MLMAGLLSPGPAALHWPAMARQSGELRVSRPASRRFVLTAAGGRSPSRDRHWGRTEPMPYASHRLAILAAAAALAVVVAAPAAAQLIPRRDLSYAMALNLATGALEACKARGYAASVVGGDRGGEIMVGLPNDKAGPHTCGNARRAPDTPRPFGV